MREGKVERKQRLYSDATQQLPQLEENTSSSVTLTLWQAL